MEERDGQVHIDTDEARGGSSPNIVRWVLGFSLVAAIIALSAIWMTGAWNSEGGYSGGASGITGTQSEAQSSRQIADQTEADRQNEDQTDTLPPQSEIDAEFSPSGDPALDPAHSGSQSTPR